MVVNFSFVVGQLIVPLLFKSLQYLQFVLLQKVCPRLPWVWYVWVCNVVCVATGSVGRGTVVFVVFLVFLKKSVIFVWLVFLSEGVATGSVDDGMRFDIGSSSGS